MTFEGIVLETGQRLCAPWLDILRGMLAPVRFIWNATRGARLRPWRSPYIRWRIETYSGMHAETLTAGDVLRFTWRERRQLLRFLRWTAEMDRVRDARPKPSEL
jgi:hypothetical protein